jgi:hypothetical protein
MFESLRLKIAQMVLRRKAARTKRQKTLFDFTSAKRVGVLCSPQNEAGTGHLKSFLHYLSQKGVQYSVLGYFDGKKVPENFLYWKGMDFITRQDLNFFFAPKGALVGKFINEPFDMLINCNIANYFPIEYMSQLSMAKCKVGIMREDESGYDLMIDIQKNQTIEYFLKNLEVYLTNLRHPQ